MAKKITKVEESDKKIDLERGFEDVENRRRKVNSDSIVSKNKTEDKRQQIVKSLLQAMSDFGVDMTDINSISAFMEKLQKENPDMAKLFEIAFGNLTDSELGAKPAASGAMPGQEGKPAIQQGGLLEKKFGNLAHGMMQPNTVTPEQNPSQFAPPAAVPQI